MIDNDALLKAVGAALVGARAGSNLTRPVDVDRMMAIRGQKAVQAPFHVAACCRFRVRPLALLGGHQQACRQVLEPGGVHVLVAVLAASAGSGIPFEDEVMVFAQAGRMVDDWLLAAQNGDRNGRRVDAATLVVFRHALNTMTSGLVLEDSQVLTGNFENNRASVASVCKDAVQSTATVRQADI